MREENIKVKVTIPIPFGKPDKNGVMYTEEAVENAVNNLHKNLPIIYRDNDKEIDGVVVGTTTGLSHIATWDFENQVCKVTVQINKNTIEEMFKRDSTGSRWISEIY